jgi:nicotinate-nucleotide adenylyltransferase
LNEQPDTNRRIGVYGGAFDPVHFGHLRSALEVRQALGLDEIRFIPSGNPPHRSEARVDAAQRIEMLELAIRDAPGVVIDRREVQNTQTSYSFDTLASVEAEYPASRVTLVIGMDQFSVFDTWYRWRELLQRFELAVMERPGESLSETARSILSTAGAETLHDKPRIALISVTQLQISSSRIRDDLIHGRDIQFLVPAAVRDYIYRHRLYRATPPVNL